MAETETLTVNLTVTAAPAAPRIPLKIPKDVSSSTLRELVSEATKIPLPKLRLIFRGKIIAASESTKAVEEFKLEDESVLHCMGKPEGGQPDSNPQTTAAATASAAAATPAGSSVTIQPPNNSAANAPAVNSSNPLQAAFDTLRSSNSPQKYTTAVTTLEKILTNIVNNPMEEKYRRVKKQNAAFQQRLGGLPGGDAAMMAAGFLTEMDNGEEVYMMHASAEKWPQLMVAKAAVEFAVRDAKAAANQASAPPVLPAGGMPSFANLPGMGPGMMSPDMQNAAARMMSDPQALQTMLQNPMVQHMMRNDPRFANNPMMRQSFEQLANNPAMVQQLTQMMRDPNVLREMQQMQSMMGGAGGGLGGMPQGGFGGLPPFGGANMNMGAASGANNSAVGQQQGATMNNGAGVNDEELTEEEMIAEAIRRSLEEGGS